MSDRKGCRAALVVTGFLAGLGCGGSGSVSAPDPASSGATSSLQSGGMDASARSGDLPADLDLVLGAERLAVVFYEAVRTLLAIDRPFSNIVLAEGNHVTSLEKLYTKREIELPAPPDDGEILEKVAGYTDISQACAGAVEHEKLIDGYYEDLLGTELPTDVAKVLRRLKAATFERHLEAFVKCAES